MMNVFKLLLFLFLFSSCAKTVTGAQANITLIDIEMAFRGNVNPYNYFYYFIFMLEESVEKVKDPALSGENILVLKKVDGSDFDCSNDDCTEMLANLPVKIIHPSITDFTSVISDMDVLSSTITLEDSFVENIPVDSLVYLGLGDSLAPAASVLPPNRGEYWTRYLLYTSDIDLTGNQPRFLHGVGGKRVEGGEEVNYIYQPPQELDFLTDWYQSAEIFGFDHYEAESISSNAIRFTLRLEEWIGSVDTFKFQILVSSEGGVDFITNELGNETGFNVDWLDPYLIELPSPLVEGFEYSEDLQGLENSYDTTQPSADLIWWRIYVR